MIKHVERMRVSWVGTDASDLMHYTAALRHFEVAEHALLRTLFPDGIPRDEMALLPRVHVEADYKVALRYPDAFARGAWAMAAGTSSVTYGYEIHRIDGVLCIRGKIVAAACDSAGQSMPLPPRLPEGMPGAV